MTSTFAPTSGGGYSGERQRHLVRHIGGEETFPEQQAVGTLDDYFAACNDSGSVIYLWTGVASPDQLKDSVLAAIAAISKKMNRQYSRNFRTNVVVDKDGGVYGFGYLWLESPELYNMLLGLNPDGSERVETHPDPNWVEPEIPLETALESADSAEATLNTPDTLNTLEKDSGTDSWGDVDAREEAVRKLYVCPVITNYLSPLMTLPNYRYTDDQLEHLEMLQATKQLDSGISGGEVPLEGGFVLAPAEVRIPPAPFSPNVLTARRVPDWVTEAMIGREFKPYASDSTTLHTHRVREVYLREPYPWVVISRGGTVFVTYNPETPIDAQIAYVMNRWLTFQRTVGGQVQKAAVRFERLEVVDRSQQPPRQYGQRDTRVR